MCKESSIEQFQTKFGTEEACVDHLFQVKWPNGFICPRCTHRHFYRINTRRLPLFECAQCCHQTSLTVGTVMEGSRTMLTKWLLALFLVSRISSGINATQLSKMIHVTYKTAWLILHKIRHAMSEADASIKLSGFVQVNDAYYRPLRRTSYPIPPKEQPLLVGASLNDQGEPYFVKMKCIPRFSKQINYNSILRLETETFKRTQIDPSSPHVEFIIGRGKSNTFKKLFPIFAKARTWINKTFRGLGPLHFNAYLDEFCFRWNSLIKNNGIFDPLIRLCMNRRAISYVSLTRY